MSSVTTRVSKYRSSASNQSAIEQSCNTFFQKAGDFLASCDKKSCKFGIKKAFLPNSQVENSTKFSMLNAVQLRVDAKMLMKRVENPSLKQLIEQVDVELGEVNKEMNARLKAILWRKGLPFEGPPSGLNECIDIYEVLCKMLLEKVRMRMFLPDHLNHTEFQQGQPNLPVRRFVHYTTRCSKRMRRVVDRMVAQDSSSPHTRAYLDLQNRIEALLIPIQNKMKMTYTPSPKI